MIAASSRLGFAVGVSGLVANESPYWTNLAARQRSKLNSGCPALTCTSAAIPRLRQSCGVLDVDAPLYSRGHALLLRPIPLRHPTPACQFPRAGSAVAISKGAANGQLY